LRISYLVSTFYFVLLNLCGCFQFCCRRSYVGHGAKKYRKFQLALERLNHEQDIQYLIEMNRVTRLLHKAKFLTRQRKAVSYGHKYVISDYDLA